MSSYCTRSDLESNYGRKNIASWADLNNSGVDSEIEARVLEAIAAASSEIDDRLRNGPYAVPFLDAPSSPATIKRICVWLAGHDLYNARGAEDAGEDGEGKHRLSGDRKRALSMLSQIHGGAVVLSVDPICDTVAPQVVPIEVSRDDSESVIGQDEAQYWT